MRSTEVKEKKSSNMLPNNDLQLLSGEPIICLYMVHDRKKGQKEWGKTIIFEVSHH